MKIIISLALTLANFSVRGQDLATDLINKAIKIHRADSLDNAVYQYLSGYQLIMIGEMHGANEPAAFVMGLAKLLADNGDSVQVGLEIPTGEMTKFLIEHSDSSIYAADFFSKPALDGRESYAWAELISRLNKNNRVKLFFFDTNEEDFKTSNNRDSLMYIKVKNQIQKNPKWKTITLSGNIHNMIQPFKGGNTMASFLCIDKELAISDKTCSLNHRCKSGERINNIGNGLELRTVNSPDSDFSKAVDYENYLYLLPSALVDRYNGIYFTRYVTAAKMVTDK